MRGRKPKPPGLRALEGNPGKRPLKGYGGDLGGIGEPPKDLDEVAAAKWDELIDPLVWGGWLTAADRDALAEYCRLYARKAKAEAMIAEQGELVATPNGFPTQSPWLQIANKCLSEMNKLRAEMGGTPSARTRVAAEKIASGESKFAGLIGIPTALNG